MNQQNVQKSSNKPKNNRRRQNGRSRQGQIIPKSLSNIDKVFTFTRSASIVCPMSNLGILPQIGSLVGQPQFAAVFTTQDFFLYFNSARTIYSTVAIPGISDLAALFDEIQLDAVEITMIGTNLPGITAQGSASIMLCTDYNDGNPPAALGDVQQYADARLVHVQPYKSTIETCRPKYLTYTQDSGGASVSAVPMRGYVRSNLQIDHFGIKGYFVTTNPAATTTVVFLLKYKYNCRIVK